MAERVDGFCSVFADGFDDWLVRVDWDVLGVLRFPSQVSLDGFEQCGFAASAVACDEDDVGWANLDAYVVVEGELAGLVNA
ncbi:MAG: hypothetical protein NWE98_08730 [Candidatus Bathyarchaeota archaeon]|nr:hypothetical protein [Candidatus Bathyarchaeota archaeon]